MNFARFTDRRLGSTPGIVKLYESPGKAGGLPFQLFSDFLGDHPHDIEAAWRFIRSGAIMLLPITDVDMPDLEQLMKRYADRPMDFADATLVHLAKRESLSTICTIDNDFETYRIEGRRKFRVVPSR